MLDLILTEKGLQVSEFGNIRITDDGWVSVLDLIQVCAEYKGSDTRYVFWKRLTESYPEVSAKCSHFKFKGRGQKFTPICNKETALEIIGLLPGKAGKKYRAIAAKLVLSYLENPTELAKVAIAKVEKPEELAEIALTARQKYLAKGYHPHMEEIKERADGDHWAYVNINKGTTRAIMQEEPKVLLQKYEEETGKKLKSARQHPDAETKINFFESCHAAQLGSLKAKDITGSKAVQNECLKVAEEFAEFMRKIGL